MKLDFIKVNHADIPDHVREELTQAQFKIAAALAPLISQISPNILMAAFGEFFVVLLTGLVDENAENLRKAARLNAQALIDNMERMIKVKGLE